MSPRFTAALTLTALLAATALSGCGMRGALERPAPMWGDKSKAEAEDAKAKKDDAAMPEPKSTGSKYSPRPQAPESQNTSIRQAPIDGAPRDPNAGPGQATDWTHPH